MGGGVHQDLGITRESVMECKPSNHGATSETWLQLISHHPPFTSQSDLFTSVIYSTFALTNKKGVAYAVGTWALVSPRNLHTKFHVSGFREMGTKSFMVLMQAYRDSSLFIDMDIYI